MKYECKNGLMACTPFEKTNIETKKVGGILVAQHKITLVELKVLVGGEKFKQGDVVCLRGSAVVLPWAKEVLTFDGLDFILVPESEVVFLKKEALNDKSSSTSGAEITYTG